MRALLAWIERRAALCMILLLVLNAYLIFQQRRDEQATCSIQRRGLPAAHLQAEMWRDINVFIQPIPGEKMPPETVTVKLATGGIARPYFAPYFALKDLRRVLPAFNAIEEGLPASRSCS